MRIALLLFPDQDGGFELDIRRLVAVYYFFKDLGIDLVLASPSGGSPVSSVIATNETDAQLRRFHTDATARDELSDTICFDQIVVEDFKAAYCLGVSASIWQGRDAEMTIASFLSAGLPVAINPGMKIDLVPHGAGAGLLIVADDHAPSLPAAYALVGAIKEMESQIEETGR
jgi:putative intracellular protease/amidase